MYKIILENILHNVGFTPRFFRGNLHLVQEKSVRFSTVGFMTCLLYRDFSMRILLKIIPFKELVSALNRCPLYTMSALDRFHCKFE